MNSSPTVCVAQMGARMHYAVPRLLEQAGMLERFYTDLLCPAVLRPLLSGRAARAALGGLADRRLTGIPAKRVRTFPLFGLRDARSRHAAAAGDMTGRYLETGSRFCRLVARAGIGDAAAVYCFNSAALELLRYARERGLTGVLEQTIAPRSVEDRLLAGERERFPGWACDAQPDPYAQAFVDRERSEWDAAEAVVCGSDFVRAGLLAEGLQADKIRVVPYGFGDAQAGERDPGPRPVGEPLRVLFAGVVGLRKGIGDLAGAAAQLRGQGIEFRAVGDVRLSHKGVRRVSENVRLAGRVARSSMAAEYAAADVCVLPSICEGSAAVCYEALNAGLPVITTPNAGSVVRDGIDGFIVPIRSAQALAEKIGFLAGNRARLAEMRAQAAAGAGAHSMAAYGERLVETLRQVISPPGGKSRTANGG